MKKIINSFRDTKTQNDDDGKKTKKVFLCRSIKYFQLKNFSHIKSQFSHLFFVHSHSAQAIAVGHFILFSHVCSHLLKFYGSSDEVIRERGRDKTIFVLCLQTSFKITK